MEKTLVRNKRRESRGDRIFYAVNLAILLLLAAIVLYPLYFIVIASISNADAVLGGRVYLYPVDITLVGYSKIIERTDVWLGYLNTIIYTFLSTVISLFVTILAGWALSRKFLPFRKFFMVFFIITMFFGGGLIPFYNVVSSLGLLDSMWAIILPSALSAWNLFMTKTFFEVGISECTDRFVISLNAMSPGISRIVQHQGTTPCLSIAENFSSGLFVQHVYFSVFGKGHVQVAVFEPTVF